VLSILLELDGKDMRGVRIEERKGIWRSCWRRPVDGIAFNEHYSGDSAQACLCARLRGYRVKAPRLDVTVRPRHQLVEDQKPGGARGDARGRGGVELAHISQACYA